MTPRTKVLAFARYSTMGASSRMRIWQFVPHLRQLGIECHVANLFSNEYLKMLYEHERRSPRIIARDYLRRIFEIEKLSSFDAIWLDKELLPWIPYAIERKFLSGSQRVIVDYDDATFHAYDRHNSRVIQYALGHKIDALMRSASVVLAGNEYIADRARLAGAKSVEVIPTVVDLKRYPKPASGRFEGESGRRIVWIGSPSSASQLLAIASSLREVCDSSKSRVRLIGAGHLQVPNVPVESLPWNEATEVSLLAGNVAGVMPLADDPWNRGKCGYKLVQYMACGLPVVASPVGVNRRLVVAGVNGYLAQGPKEWAECLRRIVTDTNHARELGNAGRAQVEESYCVDAVLPKVAAALVG